jgi:hypothetical protein
MLPADPDGVYPIAGVTAGKADLIASRAASAKAEEV